MLKVKLDKENKIITLEPHKTLTQKDFQLATKTIDPFIEQNGNLNGIIIYTEFFPGWDSFSALIEHFKFIQNHHKKVSHIAFVTDSIIKDFSPTIIKHFVKAIIKNFEYKDLNKAREWILGLK